jgi:nucleotide-binding universal stress UspA family protein
MKKIQRMLFPVDLTEASEKMVPWVSTTVQKFDASLDILFVVRIFQYFTSIYVPHPSIDIFEKELLEGAQKKMEEFKAEHFGNLTKINAVVILGDPAETILSYIDEKQIDMVVMGTHGRKGLDRVIFGSVAERVIKNSSVPVLVINPFKAG